MAAVRRRLDAELVRRGLVPSRERARIDIAAGRVTVAGAPATKAGRLVSAGEPVLLVGPGPRYVSRGGEKLAGALDRFAVSVGGTTALDAGASTGGFTDCLLQRGAARVIAVDVGRGQLHERLRADPRVTVVERTNIRNLTLDDIACPPGAVPSHACPPGADPSHACPAFPLVVADLSFISLRTVAPALLGLVAPGGDLVLLVKPQFEAGRAAATRGRGVVTDPDEWRGALERVRERYEELGAAMMGLMVSPLRGAAGNVEFLLHCVAGGAQPAASPSWADQLEAAIDGGA